MGSYWGWLRSTACCLSSYLCFLQPLSFLQSFSGFCVTFSFQCSSHGSVFAFGAPVAFVLVLSQTLLVTEKSGGLLASTVPFVAVEA
jgi:hypothetical protein